MSPGVAERVTAGAGFATLRRDVVEPGLCTRCGTCVGVCPKDAVRFEDPLGLCLPVADEAACVDCDAPCLTGCPGADVDFPELNRWLFGGPPQDYLLGHTTAFHVGHATDPEIRAGAASGGVITAVLEHLLQSGEIAGVACLIDDPDRPLLPRPVIATDVETLRAAQQSKYTLTPVNTVLAEIAAFGKPVAFVGLPDQVQSIRKLQVAGHPSVAHIKLIVGSFCGAVNHFSSVREFVRKHGVEDLDQIERIEYRAGAWPGTMRVTLKDGRRLELAKFYANYMNLFYVVERSLFCVDLSNELADISAGDAWAPRYESRHEGFSLVITRTEAGRRALETSRAAGVIELEETDRADALVMHSHGLFNKKIAVWSRLDLRELLGRPAPDYHYRAVVTTRSRVVGAAIALVYEVGQTRWARFLMNLLPLEFTGKAFAAVRKRWRKQTRPGRSGTLQTYDVIERPGQA
ncbi:MAG: Coenzyme F420 hydrogenase/dehydrogenase, beta subunit C-terminal domain [Gemmatimonadota bacterium]